jgi:hypothetical protein
MTGYRGRDQNDRDCRKRRSDEPGDILGPPGPQRAGHRSYLRAGRLIPS